jgi:hypothetical protein
LSQEAWIGRWTRVAVGQVAFIRSIEAAPLWEEPLSTTQNTCRAEAYGSVFITWVTRSVKGEIPVLGAMLPITRAWWTS